MISFSDDAYRQYFYRHWDWMAETGAMEKNKKYNGNILELAKFFNRLERNLRNAVEYECFACGAADRTFEDGDCDNCPVYDGPTKCFYDTTEFRKWETAKTKKSRQKYAHQIAHLPWRGKSREEWEKEDGIC